MLTTEQARELATHNNVSNARWIAITEEINKAVNKGKMYACYHRRIPNYIKEKLEAFGYTIYEQTDLAPDGEFRGYITYIKW